MKPMPDLRDGACATPDGRYLTLMMPEDPGADLAAARRVCQGCPVREACLGWALRHEPYGVWGGTTESERARLRTKLGIRLQVLGLTYGTDRRRAS